MSSLMHLTVLGLVAFAATWMLTPPVMKLAFKLDAVDYPSARRMNDRPMPRLGGVAMYGGLLVAMGCELLGETLFGWTGLFGGGRLQINYPLLLGGLGLMCLLGAVDDVHPLTPLVKLIGQVLISLLIVYSGVFLGEIENPLGSDPITLGWWGAPLTMLYLVIFVNVINLLDGIDGLAAGVVGIAAFVLFIIAYGRLRLEPAFLAILLFAVCLAFLRFNFYPADIYMGDSGSLLLGALLGVVSLVGVMRTPTFTVLLVPIVIAGVPIIDTIYAIIRRLRGHQPVQQADMGHLHHRLVRSGLSIPKAVFVIYGWTTLLALGGIAISNTRGLLPLLVFLALALLSFLLLWRIGIYEPILRHHYIKRTQDIGKDVRKGEGQQEEDG